MPTDQEMARALADIFGQYIDEPNRKVYSNPTYTQDPRFNALATALSKTTGQDFKEGWYNPQQFGELQNPPQYRGIRLLLPPKFWSNEGEDYKGEYRHLNNRTIPGYEKLQQTFLGEMIRRGYPVLGGGSPMEGFEKGFNPVGFGQR